MRRSFCSTTAMILQAVDGLSNLGRGQLIQPHFAQFANQIDSEFAVALQGFRRTPPARMLLQPIMEVACEGGAANVCGSIGLL
jgi:hypothetical protein